MYNTTMPLFVALTIGVPEFPTAILRHSCNPDVLKYNNTKISSHALINIKPVRVTRIAEREDRSTMSFQLHCPCYLYTRMEKAYHAKAIFTL